MVRSGNGGSASVRHPLRKLLVLGCNEVVGRGLVSLAPVDGQMGFVLAEIAERESLIAWSDAGFGELRLTVWWDYQQQHDPNFDRYGKAIHGLIDDRPSIPGPWLSFAKSRLSRVMGAASSGWLERRTGPHLQGKGPQRLVDTYLRLGTREIIDRIPTPNTLGFAAEGRFFL